MLVGVEKIRIPVARLDWGDGQTKSDAPTDIFSQGRKRPLARGAKSPRHIQPGGAKSQLQTSHSADVGTYQASVAAGKV